MNNNDNDPFPNPFDQDQANNSNPAFNNSNLSPIEDETSGRTFVWLMLDIAAIGCGLLFAAAFFFFQPDAQSLVDKYFPSPTSTFTRTPTQTATITPSPTQTATPTPNLTATAKIQQVTNTALAFEATATAMAQSWKVSESDSFESNRNNWLTGTYDDEYTKTTYTLSNGTYKWNVTAHKSTISWIRTSTESVDNFNLTMDVRQASGPTSADSGVVFREDKDGNFYYFGINNKEQYLLYAFYNGEWDTLIDTKTNHAIQLNEFNRITIIVEDSHFIFFVNGQFITEFADDRIKSGKVALAIELDKTDESAIFEFDDFELRTL